MIMPGRMVEDGSVQCAPVTRSRWVTKANVGYTIVPASNGPAFQGIPPFTDFSAQIGTTAYSTIQQQDDAELVTMDNSTNEEVACYTALPAIQAGQVGVSVTLDVTPTQGNSTTYVTLGKWKDLSDHDQGIDVLRTGERLGSGKITVSATEGFLAGDVPVVALRCTDFAQESDNLLIADVTTSIFTKVAQSYVTLSCDTDGAFHDNYRFGFNNQAKDDEIAGVGNHYAYTSSEYDPRFVRWWKQDNLAAKHPEASPYANCLGNPIKYIDKDGNDVSVSIDKNTISFSSTIYITGPGAAGLAKSANEAFGEFSKTALQNRTYTDVKSSLIYNVTVAMHFVAADDDPTGYQTTLNAKPGESGNNIINITSDQSKLMNQNRANAQDGASDNYKKANYRFDFVAGNGKIQTRTGNGVGNMIWMSASDLNGKTAVHEGLHNFGLGDRYIEGACYASSIPLSSPSITASFYSGYQTDMMACRGLDFNKAHVENLAGMALSMHKASGQNNFVMATKVDAASKGDTKSAVQSFESNGVKFTKSDDCK